LLLVEGGCACGATAVEIYYDRRELRPSSSLERLDALFPPG
jgi:hypothetical protein